MRGNIKDWVGIITLLFITSFLIGCAAPSPRSEESSGEKLIIAILNFQNKANQGGSRLGHAVVDMMNTAMLKSGKFRVIERTRVEAILKEQNLSTTGAIDQSTASEVGKILGVKAVILGNITEYGIERRSITVAGQRATSNAARAVIDARVIDTETAELLAADMGEGSETSIGGGISMTMLDSG